MDVSGGMVLMIELLLCEEDVGVRGVKRDNLS